MNSVLCTPGTHWKANRTRDSPRTDTNPPGAERERPMKTKRAYRPWIKPNGKPLSDFRLKRMSRTWDAEMWEAYLHWYQRPCKEALISDVGYRISCENRSKSIYEECGYEHDELVQKYCEILLRSLPKVQANV